MGSKRCRHRAVQLWWRWFGTWINHHPRLYSFDLRGHVYGTNADRKICDDCGVYLSLGPATITPDVEIEIRAAEIAALEHEGLGW